MARSIPPVLDPLFSDRVTQAAQRDLDVLMAYAGARARAKPITTLSTPATPAVVVLEPLPVTLARRVIMPAIEYAGRELMSRDNGYEWRVSR
jgi:hypothetical protein